MTDSNYSVLMSVYAGDNSEFLKESIESILNQTLKTDNFVIVIDGPISNELSSLLDNYKNLYPDIISIVPLKVNQGLGLALNEGLKHCTHEIIMRQDSDDISFPDRAKRQFELMLDGNFHIISGTILEFIDSTEITTGKRQLPETEEEIIKFSRKRTPFNHPAVMFRKDAVLASGGYNEEYHLFEDYYLWVRMLMRNARCANISEPVVYMRVDKNTMVRRGGKKYAKDMLRFHKWLLNNKWSSNIDYLTGAIPHAIICILPAPCRKLIYKILH